MGWNRLLAPFLSPVQGYWIGWVDESELRRLRELRARSHRSVTSYSPELTTPKTPAHR